MVGSTPPLILPATITWTITSWDGLAKERECQADRFDQRQYEIEGKSSEEGPLEDNDWIEIGVYEIDGLSYQGYPVHVGICTNSVNPLAADGALAIVDAATRTILAVPRGGLVENTVTPITLAMLMT